MEDAATRDHPNIAIASELRLSVVSRVVGHYFAKSAKSEFETSPPDPRDGAGGLEVVCTKY